MERICLRGPHRPDIQALTETLCAFDHSNLELSLENAYLVDQIIYYLKTHAEKRDELKRIIANMKTTLETYKDQMKDDKEGFLSFLKRFDTLVMEIMQMQDFQMEELQNAKAASQDPPEGVGSEENTQTDDPLQQIQNYLIIRMNQIQEKVKEESEMIDNLKAETKAKTRMTFRFCSKLVLKQAELDQSIKKCNALKQEFKKNLAKREESWEMRKNEMEERWLEKEGTLNERVSKAEEELEKVKIQNIKLQELVSEKKNQDSCTKTRQENRNTEEEVVEEAAACPAQVGHKEEEENKEEGRKGKKMRKLCFWRKKRQQVEETTSDLDQPGQEERQTEEKPKKRGFWKWGHKKQEARAQRPEKEEEGAACPETEEQ